MINQFNKQLMNNKYVWLVVAILVVVVGYVWMGGDQATGPDSSGSPSPSGSAGSTASPSAGRTKTPTGTPQDNVSYTNLLKQYQAAGTLVQFDANCQMSPNKPTFKNGTRVMLDSRVNTPRTITIGSKSYPMLSYGFRLETLSSSTLPQTLVVDCGNRQNVGTILLQR